MPPSTFQARWQHPWAQVLAWGQGLFYLVSGSWPLLRLSSFLALTGPKRDVWLAQTVGALLAVTGLALLLAARNRRLSPEWALVAGGQAATLGLVDVVMVARDRIGAIYLYDAVVEVALVVAWIVTAVRIARAHPSDRPSPA